MSKHILDIAVVAVLVLSGGFAYMRGFVREVLSVVAWVGAAAIAIYGYAHLAPLMGFLPKGPIRNGGAGAAIFIVALIILTVITGTIAHRVSQSGLSSIDRVFGLLFGLARGAILVCLGYIALVWYLPPNKQQPDWVNEARSKWFLEQGAQAIQRLVPQILPQQSKVTAAGAAPGIESTVKALMSPQPAAKPPPGEPDYNPRDRQDMNRLIDQQRGQHQ
jgi:membrane protein required for colicin V production